MADDYEIRVDGETGAPQIELPHGRFGLGLKESRLSAHFGRYPPVEATYPDIPSSQWTEQDFRPWCLPTTNQGQSSACGPFTTKELTACAFAISGQAKPNPSAWFVYGVLNRGRDNGTSLPDLLMVAEKYGLPDEKLVKQGDFSGRYSQAVYDDALRRRIEAAYNAPTLENLCSVAERRQVACIGIDIGSQFVPDGEGFVAPYKPSPQGVLGHAVGVVGKKYARGMWWPLCTNHWRPEWNPVLDGFFYLHPSYINVQFGGWALRVPAWDTNDPNAPAAL